MPYVRHSSRKITKQSSSITSNNSVTVEEAKLIRVLRDQFDRRGGFVRIFPTADTWKKYSKYLDPISGIPTFGTTQYSGQISTANYNKMIHSHSFPNSVVAVNRNSLNGVPKPMDRLLRYERSLNNQYRKEFFMDMSVDENDQTCVQNFEKSEITKFLKRGSQLSDLQNQVAFGAYLQRVLCTLKGSESKFDEKVTSKESICDVVLQFLHTVSQGLTMPLQFKRPSKYLKGNDKIAVTAKHLCDFLFFYVQEAKCATLSEALSMNTIPEDIFGTFLKTASKNDIEEILIMNLKLSGTETRPSKCSRLSKLSLFQVFKRVENNVLSKVTD